MKNYQLSGIFTRIINELSSIAKNKVLYKVIGAIFTQSMLSIINMMIQLFLIRLCSKEEYAIFIILFNSIGIVAGVQNALANSPLTVYHNNKDGEKKNDFISGIAFSQLLIFLPLSSLIMIGLIISTIFTGNLDISIKIIFFILATLAFLSKEFIRTVHYIRLNVKEVTKMDFVFLITVAVALGVILLLKKMSSNTAMIALMTGYLVSAISGYLFLKDKFYYKKNIIKNALKETWKNSLWSLVGVAANVVETRSYIFIVSIFISLAGTADIQSSRLLLMPINLIVTSSMKIFMAKGSELFGKLQMNKMIKFTLLMVLFLFSVWIVYSIVLLLFYNTIVGILGDKYQNIFTLVLLWAGLFLFNTIRYPIVNSLLIFKEFKAVTLMDLTCGATTLILCLILTHYYQAPGAMIALIAGEILLLSLASGRWIYKILEIRKKGLGPELNPV